MKSFGSGKAYSVFKHTLIRKQKIKFVDPNPKGSEFDFLQSFNFRTKSELTSEIFVLRKTLKRLADSNKKYKSMRQICISSYTTLSTNYT